MITIISCLVVQSRRSQTTPTPQTWVIDDTEWMRTCFRLGTIKENWKRIQESKWCDPAFEDFIINKEVVAYVEREIR
jgi:hypothetical protein